MALTMRAFGLKLVFILAVSAELSFASHDGGVEDDLDDLLGSSSSSDSSTSEDSFGSDDFGDSDADDSDGSDYSSYESDGSDSSEQEREEDEAAELFEAPPEHRMDAKEARWRCEEIKREATARLRQEQAELAAKQKAASCIH